MVRLGDLKSANSNTSTTRSLDGKSASRAIIRNNVKNVLREIGEGRTPTTTIVKGAMSAYWVLITCCATESDKGDQLIHFRDEESKKQFDRLAAARRSR